MRETHFGPVDNHIMPAAHHLGQEERQVRSAYGVDPSQHDGQASVKVNSQHFSCSN